MIQLAVPSCRSISRDAEVSGTCLHGWTVSIVMSVDDASFSKWILVMTPRPSEILPKSGSLTAFFGRFMVERGHFDGVAPDETVAYEFAKVRHLYAAQLKIPERVEIEWFDGPHTINGKATFDFLHLHLDWPAP